MAVTAARLCGLAHAGEVIATDSVVHLAGRLEGVKYLDRGRVHLKGIAQPVHILELRREVSPAHGAGWSWRPLDWSKALGWRLALAVFVIAAGTAAAVVLLTTRGPSGGAATKGSSSHEMETGGMVSTIPSGKLTPVQRLNSYVRNRSWACQSTKSASVGSLASLVCRTDVPERLQLTLFRGKRDLERAYSARIGRTGIRRSSGGCAPDNWRGEAEWFHGEGEPAGRGFCYLSEAKQQSYITWTSEAGAKILGVARLDSLQHRKLFFWWTNVRHDIV